jgi:hypothetical protein
VRIGDALYVLGGNSVSTSTTTKGPLSSVEQARISGADLAPFQLVGSLNTPRSGFGLITTGDHWVYAIGGLTFSDATKMNDALTATIERAEITSTGLGTFSTVKEIALTRPRGIAAVVQLNGYVYVLGGIATLQRLDAYERSIERATISSSGDLGNFEDAGVMLPEGLAAPVVVNGEHTFFLLGGFLSDTMAPDRTDQVLRADLAADGRLGGFTAIGHLPTAIDSGAAVVVGDAVYFVGGGADGDLSRREVDRGLFSMDGSSLGAFTKLEKVELANGRQSYTLTQVGQAVYAVGGVTHFNQDTSRTISNSVERAAIE